MEKDSKNTMSYEPNDILQMAIEPAPVMGRKVMQGTVDVIVDSEAKVYNMTFTPVDPVGGGGMSQDIINMYNFICKEEPRIQEVGKTVDDDRDVKTLFNDLKEEASKFLRL